MKSFQVIAVVSLLLASGMSAPVASAEDTAKALPTLLIKGEVISLDTADQQAILLKVRDRYGFETPIFVTSESKVLQADAAVAIGDVAVGSGVEVEYNFDVNTAKRHAVSVKVTQPKAAAAPAAPVETPAPAASGPADAAPAAAQAEPVAEPTPAAAAAEAAPAAQ